MFMFSAHPLLYVKGFLQPTKTLVANISFVIRVKEVLPLVSSTGTNVASCTPSTCVKTFLR